MSAFPCLSQAAEPRAAEGWIPPGIRLIRGANRLSALGLEGDVFPRLWELNPGGRDLHVHNSPLELQDLQELRVLW